MSAPHTLEKLAAVVPDEERLHASLLLAHVNALYRTLGSFSVPAPLYRFLYDAEANHLQLTETQGNAWVPRPGACDISALDIVIIANLRDLPVLFEGETGVGKTYVSQSFLSTLLPRASCLSLRLSGNTFLNNVFQPFLEGRIENGMPVTRIKPQAVEQIAGMFVDEINRGDPQNVLQLLDNELYNAGEYVRLGLRIPHLRGGNVTPGTRRKKLAILTAQNPPGTVDPRFATALELDAAVDNRLLKINFGNAAGSAGAALWLETEPADLHASFLVAFRTLACRFLGAEGNVLDQLGDDWLSLYAWITDPAWTEKPTLYSALELADLLIGALSGPLSASYQQERQVCRDWHARLGLAEPRDMDLADTERSQKIQAALGTFKVPVIFRDVVQVKKLADVLATLTSLKGASASADPVQSYLKTPRIVTVREVAWAAALMARNKQPDGSESVVPVINEVLTQYIALAERAQKATRYLRSRFDAGDANAGVKKLVLVKALRETVNARKGALHLRGQILALADKLRDHFSASEDVRNLLLMRLLADLLTLCGFLTDQEAAVDVVLAAATPGTPDVPGQLLAIFHQMRQVNAPTVPDIYQHRLRRTLGG
jgi:hypothetical protein